MGKSLTYQMSLELCIWTSSHFIFPLVYHDN